MFLFDLFRSFLPMHNPIGFGASDFLLFAVTVSLSGLLVAKAWFMPFAHKIAKQTQLCMFILFALAILLRIALLPEHPVPVPSGADDFSYILLADTLRHFRLANATHPLHQFFEAVFILQQPAYASIYPLGQGLFLAAGRLVLQSYWAGVLISSGLLAAFCYWMLRGWVAPVWAMAGGLLAIIEFGPLSSWTNSYWGGSVSAIAGCLVFGTLPRWRRSAGRMRYGVLLGVGFGLQMLTRPFEALFLAAAAAVYFVLGMRGNWRVVLRPLTATAGIIAAAATLMLLQNKATTHSWTTMPYMLSRYEYGVPTTFTFQPNPVPHRQLTAEQELDYKAQAIIHGPGADSASAFFSRLGNRVRFLRFFLLPPLYLALAFSLWKLRCWQVWWVAATVLLFALGTNVYPYFYPHYVAAATCLFVLMSVWGLNKLGRGTSQYVYLLCGVWFLFWFGTFLSGNGAVMQNTAYQTWYYINPADPQGRVAVANKLAQSDGRQLVFVRYSPFHRFEEWIHNEAEIDAAQTVYANDLGADENQKLISYYPNRTVWLLEPDAHPPALQPYPGPSDPFLTVH